MSDRVQSEVLHSVLPNGECRLQWTLLARLMQFWLGALSGAVMPVLTPPIWTQQAESTRPS